MKKIISVIICVILLIPTFSSCSKKPELSELMPRLEELLREAEEVNQILFGEGLPVYEHIEDPKGGDKLKDYTEKTIGENGEEIETLYYYYVVPDSRFDYKIIAFLKSGANTYTYVRVAQTYEEKSILVYKHPKAEIYAYLLEGYAEPVYEYFYDEDDPEDYDYVRVDCPYKLVSHIKAKAEKVYSADYLKGLELTMFVSGSMPARYMNYTDGDGNIWLTKSREYKPLITETRKFDLSTAKMVRPSNSSRVNIEVESYLPSAPENRTVVRITLVLQNGVWMLDSPTY